MKKNLFVLAFILVSFQFHSFAQKGFYSGFSANVGSSVVANQNIYGVKWSGLGTFDPAHKLTIGYGFSGKIGYNVSPPIGFLAEIGYQKRGQNYEDTDSKGTTHGKSIDLNYINTGIYFRYTSIFRKNYYKQEQKIRLAIVIGPQFNVLVSAQQKYSLSGDAIDLVSWPFDISDLDYPSNNPPFWTSDYNFTNNDNDKELFRNFDIGLMARVGVDIYPKPWFFISPTITSYISLTDINNSDYTDHSGYGMSRNIAIGFDIGFGFYISNDKSN